MLAKSNYKNNEWRIILENVTWQTHVDIQSCRPITNLLNLGSRFLLFIWIKCIWGSPWRKKKSAAIQETNKGTQCIYYLRTKDGKVFLVFWRTWEQGKKYIKQSLEQEQKEWILDRGNTYKRLKPGFYLRYFVLTFIVRTH